MYKKTVWEAGDYRIVKKCHSFRHPGGKRGKRQRRTPEAVQRENEKQRKQLLQILILANFQRGDLWVTLPYAREKRPDTVQEAKERFRAFIRKLRDSYRREGMEIRWIVTTERGKRGGCHHHLIINNLPGLTERIANLWTWAKKTISEHLYEDGEFEKLAEYVVKSETKENVSGTNYSRSRNLIVPEAKTEIVGAKTFYEEPRAVKGYEILKNSIENGTNQFTGFPYQRYIMKKVRVAPGKRRKDGGKRGEMEKNSISAMDRSV